jgi:hypothetical protein
MDHLSIDSIPPQFAVDQGFTLKPGLSTLTPMRMEHSYEKCTLLPEPHTHTG